MLNEDLFWSRVNRREPGECWPWTGSLTALGYGKYHTRRKTWKAHRLVYTLLIGPIPEGLELDHLCRNRRCVNPAHMEPVTHRVNTLRSESVSALNAVKTACVRGHPFDELNTVAVSNGRRCRECKRAKDRRRQHQANARRRERRGLAPSDAAPGEVGK